MIVLFEMNNLVTEKPYHLNTLPMSRILVGKMFGWRKKNSAKEENICPYCNTPNPVEAKECKLCYYELKASAREQPLAQSSSAESEIMTTLLDTNVELESEEHAVEAVLSLEDVTVEVEQFEVVSQDEADVFDFILSSGPTLSSVKDYQPAKDVELLSSDAPSEKVEFLVPESNPLDEVEEPIHTGQGSLFTVDTETTDDMTGTVGPSIKGDNMQPQIVTEEQIIPEVQLTSPQLVDVMDTPEIPDILDNNEVESSNLEPLDDEITTPDLPDVFDHVTNIEQTQAPQIPTHHQQEISDVTDFDVLPLESETSPKPTPEPSVESVSELESKPSSKPASKSNINGETTDRIWPWPAEEAWDESQVYREVVSILELVKAGKLSQTAEKLDALGPHLHENLDMLAHIGTVMRYLGREEHLQWMLRMAEFTYPQNQSVASAIAHLS